MAELANGGSGAPGFPLWCRSPCGQRTTAPGPLKAAFIQRSALWPGVRGQSASPTCSGRLGGECSSVRGQGLLRSQGQRGLEHEAAEQCDEADEARGSHPYCQAEVRPRAPWRGGAHRFAAYRRCSADMGLSEGARPRGVRGGAHRPKSPVKHVACCWSQERKPTRMAELPRWPTEAQVRQGFRFGVVVFAGSEQRRPLPSGLVPSNGRPWRPWPITFTYLLRAAWGRMLACTGAGSAAFPRPARP